MKIAAVILGLVLSNFGYQWMQDVPVYLTAIERSYFMIVAIAAYIFVDKYFYGNKA